MTSMVEKVARAIAGTLGEDWNRPTMFMQQATDTHETCREVYRDMARAAIEAMREPTEAIEEAIWLRSESRSTMDCAWRAAIDAALAEQSR